MVDSNYDIDVLISKLLSGEAGEEELKFLDSWEKFSVENKKYLEQSRALFAKAVSAGADSAFDTDAGWQKVKQKLAARQNVKAVVVKPLWTPLRVAAAIAVVVSVTMLIFRYFREPVQQFALTTTDAAKQDTLPDGTVTFLNRKSSIAFEYNPRQKTRSVKLKGEGYFEVKHQEEKPFIIQAEELIVKDIGTSFNVKAWPESDTVEVAVQSGEVQIYTLRSAGIRLVASETGLYHKKSGGFSKRSRANPNALSYKTRNFNFDNTTLLEVVTALSDVYGNKITLKNPALVHCKLTVDFHGENIDTIISVISETLNLTTTVEGTEITLDGAACH